MSRSTRVSRRVIRSVSAGRRSSTILPQVSQTGQRPDRPAVPGTCRTVTETWTGQSQTADFIGGESRP